MATLSMERMKSQALSTLVGIFVASLALPASAMPIGSGNDGYDYLFKGNKLDWLSAGIYILDTDRGIQFDGTTVSSKLKTRQRLVYIGINAGRWFSVYGLGGEAEARIGAAPYSDPESVYGGGVRINLLDHEVTEPTLMEDRWRVNLGAQYTMNETSMGTVTWDWEELSVALTFGIVNDTLGNKYYTPESIVLYIGPIYSALDSDRFSEKDDIGMVGGMEIFFTDSISLDVEVQRFEDTSLGAGLNIHF